MVDVLKGRAKPNRVTWFMWTLAPAIALFAQIQEGVGLQSLLTFSVGFNPFLIFVASFINKDSYWKLKNLDYAFGAMSLLGLFLWWLTGDGIWAISFAIIADLLAAIPTIQKSYTNPESESWSVFGFGFINAFIVMLTIDEWRFEEYAFIIYILLITATLFSLIKFEIGPKIEARKRAV